jgi:hypothetical protein
MSIEIFKNKLPKEFQDSLPVFIFFLKKYKKKESNDKEILIIKSKYYNSEKMLLIPFHKPLI